ncbi:MAG: hypothetical protein JWQ38_2436 [Flavipsychrobacter sp.]|nr:hypothetical protein [Flavipsychrobacter sp.]
MKDVGGYFELELQNGGNGYHNTPYALKSGRASLYHILAHTKPSLVYIPFYTCNALMEPFDALGIKYQFYAITELLEPVNMPDLEEGEYFVYVNYMGLKDKTMNMLSAHYKDKLIADCTQAFFTKGNGVSWFFNSCRKFFGVPDGSYLYCPQGVSLQLPGAQNEDYIIDHLMLRYNGHTRDGYPYFTANEEQVGRGIDRMSYLGECLLSRINYKEVMDTRVENYSYLHSLLRDTNLFNAAIDEGMIPMCYPYLPASVLDKASLGEQNIFIPSFWADVLQRNMEGFDIEKKFAAELCPLPVDHRYTTADMEFVYRSIAALS